MNNVVIYMVKTGDRRNNNISNQLFLKYYKNIFKWRGYLLGTIKIIICEINYFEKYYNDSDIILMYSIFEINFF